MDPLSVRPLVTPATQGYGARTPAALGVPRLALDRLVLSEPATEREDFCQVLGLLAKSSHAEAAALYPQACALWFAGDFSKATVTAFYESLRQTAAADTALKAKLDDAERALLVPKSLAQYYENSAGRYFDSVLADHLVQNPPPASLRIARAAGARLRDLLATGAATQPRAGRLDAKTTVYERLAAQIQADRRPWFARCPDIADFLAQPNAATAQNMLGTISSGFDVVKSAYLTVRSGWALQEHGVTPPWIRTATEYYVNVIGEYNTFNRAPAAHVSPRPGITLNADSVTDLTPADFTDAKSWTADKVPRYANPSPFLESALRRGKPVVNGLSGSANILGFFHRELTAQHPELTMDDGLLQATMFLVYDGGHSVHEVAAIHSMVAKLQPSLCEKYRSKTGPQLRKYIASYTREYLNLMPADPTNVPYVCAALKTALEKTIARNTRE